MKRTSYFTMFLTLVIMLSYLSCGWGKATKNYERIIREHALADSIVTAKLLFFDSLVNPLAYAKTDEPILLVKGDFHKNVEFMELLTGIKAEGNHNHFGLANINSTTFNSWTLWFLRNHQNLSYDKEKKCFYIGASSERCIPD